MSKGGGIDEFSTSSGNKEGPLTESSEDDEFDDFENDATNNNQEK